MRRIDQGDELLAEQRLRADHRGDVFWDLHPWVDRERHDRRPVRLALDLRYLAYLHTAELDVTGDAQQLAGARERNLHLERPAGVPAEAAQDVENEPDG